MFVFPARPTKQKYNKAQFITFKRSIMAPTPLDLFHLKEHRQGGKGRVKNTKQRNSESSDDEIVICYATDAKGNLQMKEGYDLSVAHKSS